MPRCLFPLIVDAFHVRPRGGGTPSVFRSQAMSRGVRPATHSLEYTTLGGAGATCKNSGGALDRCNRSKRAALLPPAAATAFSELLGLSPTIRSLRKHT